MILLAMLALVGAGAGAVPGPFGWFGCTCPAPPPAAPIQAKHPAASAIGKPPPDMADMLRVHNNDRRVHHAPPLAWNSSVAYVAQAWANRCQIGHDQRAIGTWGENILWGTVPIAQAIYDAPRMWYDESKTYNYAAPTPNHFTQMVWRSTRALGCGKKICPHGTAFVVCRYWPPGNVLGQFAKNVLGP